MTRPTFLLLIYFLSLINCFGQTDTNSVTADHYQTKRFNTTIFPSNYVDLTQEKRYTPTRLEIDKAEASLKDQLKDLNQDRVNQSSSPIIHKKLKRYNRQYFGYIDDKGHKILLINAYWVLRPLDIHGKNWLNKRISVLDGGSRYWSVKYNLHTDKLFDLNINGGG